MRGLDWQPLQIPLIGGLDTGTDSRALNPPSLAECVDAEFETDGCLTTRKPFATVGANVTDSSGNPITSCRKIVSYGDQLVMFTADSLYSWSASDSTWRYCGQHLAVGVEESSPVSSVADQWHCTHVLVPEVGYTLYAWENRGEITQIFLAAVDTTTGSFILPPTAISSTTTYSRPRLLRVGTTVVLLFYDSTSVGVNGFSINPLSAPSTWISAPTLLMLSNDGRYDAVSFSDGDSFVLCSRRATTTTYAVGTYDGTALANIAFSTKARTCNNVIAVAVTPDDLGVQIVRDAGGTLEGDYLDRDLVDVNTGLSIGTLGATPNQVGLVYSPVEDSPGVWGASVWWSHSEATTPVTCKGYVLSDGSSSGSGLGTFRPNVSIASKPFCRDNVFYCWLTFDNQTLTALTTSSFATSATQSCYVLIDEAGVIHARAANNYAGGYSPRSSHLPPVEVFSDNANKFIFLGTERRVIPTSVSSAGPSSNYANRAILPVICEFDLNSCRRTAQLGETLYVAGGLVQQCDGICVREVGFQYGSWKIEGIDTGTGLIETDGTYTHKITYSFTNARGEFERSTPFGQGLVTTSTAPTGGVQVPDLWCLSLTNKNSTATGHAVALEHWRSAADTSEPLYLTTSVDPSVTSGANRFVYNSTSTASSLYIDSLSTANLTVKEQLVEGVLENLPPPAASIIHANSERLFLAGVPKYPNRVWYSKIRNVGEIAAFNDALTVDVPAAGGAITAVATLQETLVVFKDSAIYLVPGDGFDNVGGGNNYGPARVIASDVGAVSAESVCLTPVGLLFKSAKGWYMLTPAFTPRFIGSPITAYDSETVVGSLLVENKHQVRILTTSRMLIWDYNVNQWARWTVSGALGCCQWNGSFVYNTNTSALVEQSTYTGTDYGVDIETPWIKLADLQGSGAVRWISLLGEYRSACSIRIRLAYNYNATDSGPTWVDDKYWTVSPTAVGNPLQVRHGPRLHKVQSVKVRITVYAAGSTSAKPTGEAVRLTGLGFEVGLKRGLFRRLPAAQKQ
jgi:hypothetical protein